MKLSWDGSQNHSGEYPRIAIEEDQNQTIVDTKAAVFHVNKKMFKPLDRVIVDGLNVLNGPECKTVLTDKNDRELRPVIENTFYETYGILRSTFKVEGAFKLKDDSEFARFFIKIRVDEYVY